LRRAVAETLLIDHVGHRGDGVARSAEGARAVPYALPGERVEVEDAGSRAQLLQVTTPSPERVAPFCPYFGRCGGCAIQHWQHQPYLAWKRGLVVDALRSAGIAAEVAPILDAHGCGRRRAIVHARRGADGSIHVGFAVAQSHSIIDIAHCPILDPELAGALDAARAIAATLAPAGKPLDIQITAASEGLDIDVRGSGPLNARLTATLARLAGQHRIVRITRHGEPVVQQATPTLMIGPAKVELPPGSFLQATAAGEAAIADEVLRRVGKAKQVADLFCGIGPFALRLAKSARVAAYDSEQTAIAALAKAARTPGLKSLSAQPRDLFRRPLAPAELKTLDAVVLDPPRQGALAQAEQIARSAVPVVIAVSCSAATFARDAAVLIGAGYRLGTVTPIDQFRHSPHVELVAAFSR
jgi:23S rRNA (uracil1939-C5)-methyltransferase